MTAPLVIESDGGATVVGPATTVPAAPPGAAASAPLLTAEAAQAELRRMMGDRGSPLYDAAHAEHGAATQRFAMLSAVARGQQPAETVAPAAGGMIDGDTNQQMLEAAAAADAPPPADPSGYALNNVKIPDPPPGGQRDEAADRHWMTEMRATAHAVGLNVLQWDSLVASYNEMTRIPAERADGYRAQVMVGLQRTWKGDFDRNIAAAQRAVRAIEAERPGFVEWLEGTGMGDSPQMITLALKIARARGLVK